MIKFILLAVIKIYQKIAPFIYAPFLASGGGCRYRPSCSEYAYQAIEKHGTLMGLRLGIKRILKCHPWGGGGCDPVN